MPLTRKSLITLIGVIWALSIVVTWVFSPMYTKIENEQKYVEFNNKLDNLTSEMYAIESRLHGRYDALHRNDVALSKCADTLGRLNLNENQKLDIIINVLTNHFTDVEIVTKSTEQ